MRKTVFCFVWMMICTLSCLPSPAEDEHIYGAWVTLRSPTCTLEGHQKRYCRHCDHWEQRYTKKLPHTVEEHFIVKEPTCTEEGVQGAYCTVCGSYLRTKLDKLGHDWVTVSSTIPATCNSKGKGTQKCSRCGKTRTGELPKLTHEWTEWNVTSEPSGKKKGTRERSCTLCGKTEKETFYEEGTLYEGMPANEEVIKLQTMLKDLGFYTGKINSGTFGGLTGKAVAAFQKRNGLKSTEVADPETYSLITMAWEYKTGRSADSIIQKKE